MSEVRQAPNDRPAKTLLVAFSVALVCAVAVSTTAVLLKPLQEANKALERKRYILEIVERLPGVERLFGGIAIEQVEAHVVELASGDYVPAIDPASYDARAAAQDPELSVELPRERDPAKIQRVPRYATVYLVKKAGEIVLMVLPVYGSGYASTLYGYLALEGDANTVVALSFYEHGETPGLGARIDDPEWRHLWQGKRAYDEEGEVRLRVVKGEADPSSPEAVYEVDGIAGATRTGRGVTRLLQFWLGEDGFGPYLATVRP